jgi:hypothetical protein
MRQQHERAERFFRPAARQQRAEMKHQRELDLERERQAGRMSLEGLRGSQSMERERFGQFEETHRTGMRETGQTHRTGMRETGQTGRAMLMYGPESVRAQESRARYGAGGFEERRLGLEEQKISARAGEHRAEMSLRERTLQQREGESLRDYRARLIGHGMHARDIDARLQIAADRERGVESRFGRKQAMDYLLGAKERETQLTSAQRRETPTFYSGGRPLTEGRREALEAQAFGRKAMPTEKEINAFSKYTVKDDPQSIADAVERLPEGARQAAVDRLPPDVRAMMLKKAQEERMQQR